jgi:adenine-specific DNA-methyltransferase
MTFTAKAVPGPCDGFPSTRYLGSKRKLLPALADAFSKLEFASALDPFSGTGAVAYLLKRLGKRVTACDALEANAVAARALVVNPAERLGGSIDALVRDLPEPGAAPGFVERTFDGVFFERDENRFVDQYLPRALALEGFRRDLALWALFQACLAKRPYNLFHRANLAMRRRDVARSFGNKATWDTPFAKLVRRFAAEADAAVFDAGAGHDAFAADALEVDPAGADLVYLDPPYVSARGAAVDYLDYYHFLEGLCRPEAWEARIVRKYRHLPLAGRGESPWSDPARIGAAFEAAIARFGGAQLVVSYRSDGIPAIDEIACWMRRAGKRVEIVDLGKYTYALSRNRASREVILVGR